MHYRRFEHELERVRELMAAIGFAPATLVDIKPESCLVLVGVQQLFQHGAPPENLEANGASVVRLESKPVRDHPNISGRKVVCFQHLGARPNHRKDFAPIEEILRDKYDPRVADSSEVRYFARR